MGKLNQAEMMFFLLAYGTINQLSVFSKGSVDWLGLLLTKKLFRKKKLQLESVSRSFQKHYEK